MPRHMPFTSALCLPRYVYQTSVVRASRRYDTRGTFAAFMQLLRHCLCRGAAVAVIVITLLTMMGVCAFHMRYAALSASL